MRLQISEWSGLRPRPATLGTASDRPDALEWDESLRYFRLSQATDDLFDAFRNLFLALESILSLKTPQQSEGSESKWLRRAWGAARERMSSPQVPSDPATLSDSALTRLKYVRNALSHAKRDRKPHLPEHAASRTVVSEAVAESPASISLCSISTPGCGCSRVASPTTAPCFSSTVWARSMSLPRSPTVSRSHVGHSNRAERRGAPARVGRRGRSAARSSAAGDDHDRGEPRPADECAVACLLTRSQWNRALRGRRRRRDCTFPSSDLVLGVRSVVSGARRRRFCMRSPRRRRARRLPQRVDGERGDAIAEGCRFGHAGQHDAAMEPGPETIGEEAEPLRIAR